MSRSYSYPVTPKSPSQVCRVVVSILLLLPFLGSVKPLFAQDQDERARGIFEEVDRRRSLIDYEQSDMSMKIVDDRGRTREREMKFFNHNEDEVSESLVIFAEPADVRGTALLSIEQNGEEVQKLYLPALGRIQTISASQKSDRFMGSDFTYEDLGAQSPDDYTFQMMAETDTATVLRVEKKGSSQYAFIHFFIDPDKYALLEAHYFNDEGERIKRLVASDYQEVIDDVWRAGKMVMYDERNDRHTELRWSDRQVNQSIPGWRFTERGLRRGL
jgi:hypothetical protein